MTETSWSEAPQLRVNLNVRRDDVDVWDAGSGECGRMMRSGVISGEVVVVRATIVE